MLHLQFIEVPPLCSTVRYEFMATTASISPRQLVCVVAFIVSTHGLHSNGHKYAHPKESQSHPWMSSGEGRLTHGDEVRGEGGRRNNESPTNNRMQVIPLVHSA